MNKPKLLFLSHRLPYPPHSGADIRTYNVWRELAQEWDIDAIVVHNKAEDVNGLTVADRVSILSAIGRVSLVPLESQESKSASLKAHVRALVRGVPYLEETFRSAAFSCELERKLQQASYDVIHVDSIALVNTLPSLASQTVVLTHHNIESDLLARRAAFATNPLVRRYLQLQAGRLRRAEAYWASRVALNICVSDDDALRLRELSPKASVITIPNAVHDEGSAVLTLSGRRSTGVFVGGLNWFPNADALEFFSKEIEPLLANTLPDFATTWIGKASEAQVATFRGHRSIHVAGYVPDLHATLNDARVFIAPLRVGGGTRLKILDAWAAGIPVVATTLACEGRGATHGRELLIGDTPADFADSIRRLLVDDELWYSVASTAREKLRAGFTWSALGGQLRGAYEKLRDRSNH